MSGLCEGLLRGPGMSGLMKGYYGGRYVWTL